MNNSDRFSALLTGSAMAASLVVACPGALAQHYPTGAEGIKGATLPPPGLYLRDYNLVYFADDVKDSKGHSAPGDFNLTAYINAIRPVWITDWKLLGGSYGMDILVPFVYQDIKVGPPTLKDSSFNLGDIFIEPVTFSWHFADGDLSIGYGVWAPTGEFDKTALVNPGKGYWSHMMTLGGTINLSDDKTWALSVLNRYEIHTENTDLHMTPGHDFTSEFALSKSLTKAIDVGVIGYYQQQLTTDTGAGAVSKDHYHVFAAGPEVNLFCSKLGMFVSARYAREFAAEGRPEGNTVCVTLTKKW